MKTFAAAIGCLVCAVIGFVMGVGYDVHYLKRLEHEHRGLCYGLTLQEERGNQWALNVWDSNCGWRFTREQVRQAVN